MNIKVTRVRKLLADYVNITIVMDNRGPLPGEAFEEFVRRKLDEDIKRISGR